MHASADRLDFAPPPQPGPVRAFVLAVIAHVLLMLALTWGINWNRESENQVAEAELWSSVPQKAAPKLVEATPTPPPPPPPIEKKVEAPVAPPPQPPVVKDPDIALEREKKKQQLAKQRQEELEKQKKLEAKKRLEEEKRELLAEKREAEERKKKEELAKTAKTQKQQEAKLAALRAEQMRRIQGLAGATGGPTATGTAQRSSGPSDSYAGRVRARVRPNIVFSDDVSGNPTAEVEVRLAPDGTITSRKVVKSSGVKSWDDAVLRALDKTEVLPRDVDGRVPPHLIIEFKPKG